MCPKWDLQGVYLRTLNGQLAIQVSSWEWMKMWPLQLPSYGCQLKHWLVKSSEERWWRKEEGGEWLPSVLQCLELEEVRGEQQSHQNSRHCGGRVQGMCCQGDMCHRLQMMGQEWPQDPAASGHCGKSSWLWRMDRLICSSCLLRPLKLSQHTCPMINPMNLNRCHIQPLWYLLNKAVCFALSYLSRAWPSSTFEENHAPSEVRNL